ncbi:hypothetical protein [Malaciobacter marinus]|uniref:Uncharacterized protein n=1 Tax=Malaciobacter marinus TaxID=505249 RepID=A0AB37A183_9BACT|nr:hypothetical protein [Malaciobacter marinus]PHO12685.1 hypothetical protein CPG38_06315 [Malaciobacter marinus]PPK62837.1 hypothetical protein B0F89_10135 [Malaciobacter marinus]SKB40972.1 hypothetical protein SAMN06295997_11013 [Malaciobacter marinus]
MKKQRRYFTLFTILLATIESKLLSLYSLIFTLNKYTFVKVHKILLLRQLKPIKLYSTNNII